MKAFYLGSILIIEKQIILILVPSKYFDLFSTYYFIPLMFVFNDLKW